MSASYANSPTSRKGSVMLRRLGIQIPFESTIEERVALLLDASPEVAAVQRAETAQIYLPDGTSFKYTPDFTVRLTDTQQFTLECKPAALVKTLLENEHIQWAAKDGRFHRLGAPLRIVTERDCSPVWLEQVKTFNPFAQVEPNLTLKARCLAVLSERGSMSMQALRVYLQRALPSHAGDVDSTLYGMLARFELFSETHVAFPECRVSLASGELLPPKPPLGSMLSDLASTANDESTPQQPGGAEPKWKRQFKDSPRGQKYRELFALYPDPTVMLSEDEAQTLAEKVGFSARTVYRFQSTLREAGAPGITFSEVVDHLASSRQGKPRNQVDARVQAIIELVAERLYFLPPGAPGRLGTLGAFYHEVEAACLQQELVPPAENTVRRYISIIEQRDPIEAERRRYGREKAQRLEARQGQLSITRYGELIAIDCSPCDVFVQDDGEVLLLRQSNSQGKGQRRGKGKPYRATLVLVVDVATSQVLRVAALPGAARAADILKVLRDVFLRDTISLEKAGVTVMPQAQGLPATIRMDGGSEFVNRQVERALQELGIHVLPRNKFSKHWGGVEERTIQTFTHSHHSLPGTSMNCIEKRGEHDTQKKAVMSLVELDRFNQRILERHNSQVRPPSVLTRQQHAQHLMDLGQSVWRPLSQPQRDYLLKRMFPQEERQCIPEGVKLHGLCYTAPALRELIVRRSTVKVAYDPDDISVAYVIHPDTGDRIQVDARLPNGIPTPLSLMEWNELKATFRAAEKAARRGFKTRGQIVAETLKEVDERQNCKDRKQKKKSTLDVGKKIRSLKSPPVELDPALTRIKTVDLEFEDYPMEA